MAIATLALIGCSSSKPTPREEALQNQNVNENLSRVTGGSEQMAAIKGDDIYGRLSSMQKRMKKENIVAAVGTGIPTQDESLARESAAAAAREELKKMEKLYDESNLEQSKQQAGPEAAQKVSTVLQQITRGMIEGSEIAESVCKQGEFDVQNSTVRGYKCYALVSIDPSTLKNRLAANDAIKSTKVHAALMADLDKAQDKYKAFEAEIEAGQ